MRFRARIEGMDKLLKKLDAIDGMHQGEALKEGLAQGGLIAIQEAKAQVPVATGDLRDSLHVGGYTELTPDYRKIGRYGALRKPTGSGKNVKVYIGSKLPYAHLVERGTVKMRARPFIRPAVDSKQGEILDKVDETIQDMIDRA